MKAVFDTNILIDYLNGHQEAVDEFVRYRQRLVSRITWMEVLVGADTEAEARAAREALTLFDVAELTPEVAEVAVLLRRERRLRLPDAIVLATAHAADCQLVTRNTKDFDQAWPEVRVPYRLPGRV